MLIGQCLSQKNPTRKRWAFKSNQFILMRRPSAPSLSPLKTNTITQLKPLSSSGEDGESMSFFKSLFKHWFLIGTALSIVFANIWPWVGSDDGPLQPKITVKYGAVVAIFFISGITMRTETMVECIKDFKMHCFIQSFSLIASPTLICVCLIPILRIVGLSQAIIEGFIVVGCMPPPVSTSVILTKAAGGNEASAIFNSALGSFLGVIITPIELLLLVDPTAGDSGGQQENQFNIIKPSHNGLSVEYSGGNEEKVALLTRIFVELSLTVVLPIIVGQFLRPRFGDKVDGWKPQLSTFASFTLLVIIYTTFCNTFCDNVCTPTDIQVPSMISSLLPTLMTSLPSSSSTDVAGLFQQEEEAEGSTIRKLLVVETNSMESQQQRHSISNSLKSFSNSMEKTKQELSHFDHHHITSEFIHNDMNQRNSNHGAFNNISSKDLLITCSTVILIQILFMFIVFYLSSSKKLQKILNVEWTRPDIVSIIFSSVHKSLTLGVPVLKIVFASSPLLSLLSLPLLMYHPIQIVLGGIAAPMIKLWVNEGIGLPTTVGSPSSSSKALNLTTKIRV